MSGQAGQLVDLLARWDRWTPGQHWTGWCRTAREGLEGKAPPAVLVLHAHAHRPLHTHVSRDGCSTCGPAAHSREAGLVCGPSWRVGSGCWVKGSVNLYGPEVKQLQGFAPAVQVLTLNSCFGVMMGFVIRKIVFKRHQGRGELGYRKSHFGFLKPVGVGGAQWRIHSGSGPHRRSCVHGAFHAYQGPSAVYRPSWGRSVPEPCPHGSCVLLAECWRF